MWSIHIKKKGEYKIQIFQQKPCVNLLNDTCTYKNIFYMNNKMVKDKAVQKGMRQTSEKKLTAKFAFIAFQKPIYSTAEEGKKIIAVII